MGLVDAGSKHRLFHLSRSSRSRPRIQWVSRWHLCAL